MIAYRPDGPTGPTYTQPGPHLDPNQPGHGPVPRSAADACTDRYTRHPDGTITHEQPTARPGRWTHHHTYTPANR